MRGGKWDVGSGTLGGGNWRARAKVEGWKLEIGWQKGMSNKPISPYFGGLSPELLYSTAAEDVVAQVVDY